VALGGTSFAVGHSGGGGGVWTVAPASAVKPSKGDNCLILGKELAHQKMLTPRQTKALAFCLEQVGQLTHTPGETTSLQNLGSSMSQHPSAGTQLGTVGTQLNKDPNALNGKNGTNGTNGAPGIGGFTGVITLPAQNPPGFTLFGAVTGATVAQATPDTVESTSPAVPMTISSLAVSLTAAPGGTNGVTVAVEAKGVAQALSCSIGAGSTTCTSPASASVTIPANTPIVIQLGGQATATFPDDHVLFAFAASQAS
jgi:hypothetical protein